MDLKKYNLYNNVLGWVCFIIAAATYLLTVEPTASFWDCPEFISQGMKLEVGHPPGNPIFMLAARFFVNFAGGDVTKAALMVNSMSALLSAGTILLLFWTITHLVKRLIVKDDSTGIPLAKLLVIYGSGLCGALVYTWSDTFWFSAVEGEVYAFSSFCTALVFWLILKWENRADEPHSDRYLVLIAYIIGVSIAVHLLNLLCIPAICLVVYYRKFKNTNATGSLITLAISAVIVALILFGIVPGFIQWAQYFELFFVNTLGCGYNVGVLVYTIIFVAVMIWSVWTHYNEHANLRNPVASTIWIRISFTLAMFLSGILFIGHSTLITIVLLAVLAVYMFRCKELPLRVLTIASLSVLVIFVGYSSYALLLIRSSANPPMNQNAPDNVFALSSYLSREQYGETPLLYGQMIAFTPNSQQQLVPASQVVYEATPNGDSYSYQPKRKKGKTIYEKEVKTDSTQADRYVEVSNEFRYDFIPKMLFPRMYSSAHSNAYLDWINAGYDDLEYKEVDQIFDESGDVLQTTTVKTPSFIQNLRYFFTYQLNHMYWRYFMWNFAGRQNDIAGEGQPNRGNWISGIPVIDNARLGDQSLLPDEFGKGNKGHNVFYMLPLLLGIIGLSWQAFVSKRGIEQFWVIFFFFFMTGIAIVLYLNQPPQQPRERDYAFAGSFYAFAIWVGMGVAGLWYILQSALAKKKTTVKGAASKAAASQKSGRAITSNKAGTPATGAPAAEDGSPLAIWTAVAAALIGIAVPLQMVSQTWDDHDRSGRYTTRDFGMNYLSSVDQNGIIFTNGDNDTFPLWYAQEVEGYRTDVRVVNLSYLTTDWYANQMRVATDGAPGIKTLAQPTDYAHGRLQYNYIEPSNLVPQWTDAGTSLEDLYRNPDALVKGIRTLRMPLIYLPSNAEAAAKAGVISDKELPATQENIKLNLLYDDSRYALEPSAWNRGITLSQALSLDMLATQAKSGWNRPVYFAMTVPNEYYLSLDPFMRNTGLAYQVTPLLNPDYESYEEWMAADKNSREGTWVATDKMYDTVTQKFRWGGLDKLGDNGEIYLDETVRRMVTTHRSAMVDLAQSLFIEGVQASDSLYTKSPDKKFAADRFTKAATILDMIDEKLPTRVMPYSIQVGAQVGELYLNLAERTGNKSLREKGMKIIDSEIDRYAAYLPYFNELQRRGNGGISSLSRVDRYVPTYLYSLLEIYKSNGGSIEKKAAELNAKNRRIDLDDLSRYLR